MQFKQGAPVEAANGERVGELQRIVVDPKTKSVSHLVVRRGLVIPDEKVIPMNLVSTSTEDKVQLQGPPDSVENLPNFEETHFVMTDEEEIGRASIRESERENVYRAPLLYWYPPVMGGPGMVAPGTAAAPYIIPDTGTAGYVAEVERNIPEGTIPVNEGADVFTSDDQKAGDVDQVITNERGEVTHFLISKGLLFKERKLVPTHWVRNVSEDRLDLGVSAKVLDSLPDYHE